MSLGTVIIIVALVTFFALVIGLHYRSGGFRFGVRGGTDVTTPDAEGETTDAPSESPGRRPD
jgi:hypothetical protein